MTGAALIVPNAVAFVLAVIAAFSVRPKIDYGMALQVAGLLLALHPAELIVALLLTRGVAARPFELPVSSPLIVWLLTTGIIRVLLLAWLVAILHHGHAESRRARQAPTTGQAL